MAASFSSGTGDPGEERLAEAARLPVARRGDPVRIQEADGDPVRPGPSAPGRRWAAAQPARHPRQPHVPVDHRATHDPTAHGGAAEDAFHLLARRARAEHEAWLGELEGIDLTLTFLRQKREETKRPARIAPVDLGIPVIAAPR